MSTETRKSLLLPALVIGAVAGSLAYATGESRDITITGIVAPLITAIAKDYGDAMKGALRSLKDRCFRRAEPTPPPAESRPLVPFDVEEIFEMGASLLKPEGEIENPSDTFISSSSLPLIPGVRKMGCDHAINVYVSDADAEVYAIHGFPTGDSTATTLENISELTLTQTGARLQLTGLIESTSPDTRESAKRISEEFPLAFKQAFIAGFHRYPVTTELERDKRFLKTLIVTAFQTAAQAVVSKLKEAGIPLREGVSGTLALIHPDFSIIAQFGEGTVAFLKTDRGVSRITTQVKMPFLDSDRPMPVFTAAPTSSGTELIFLTSASKKTRTGKVVSNRAISTEIAKGQDPLGRLVQATQKANLTSIFDRRPAPTFGVVVAKVSGAK